MENIMFYLKIDTLRPLDNENSIAGINGVSIVVSNQQISSTAGVGVPDHVAQALVDIRVSTRVIEEWAVDPQPPSLSDEVPSSAAQPVDKPREREAVQSQPVQPQPQPDLAPKSEQLFQVNEEATTKFDIDEWATELNNKYESTPKARRTVIRSIAGMVRLDMLRCKELFAPELRSAVVGNILRRDTLKTGIIPPDLAAFLDDRPLNETIGSRQWDPGSEKAKDSVSPNWSASKALMDNISKQASDDEFSHMYASTEDMDVKSVEANAKSLFGLKS
jgi:hypothetical protein